MTYQTHTLSNGIRIILEPRKTAVTYCGMVINVGSRDEAEEEYGMAHFIEHMLFKGTEKRRSRQIINYLENVGGEMNAYTSKEETVVYTSVLKEYTERAIELVGDVVLHSVFPQKEIDKEIEIILDEIQMYNDSPSDLIYDDFEEILFANHSLEHNILGKPELLERFTSADAKQFTTSHYNSHEMIFFLLGDFELKKVVRWAEKHFQIDNSTSKATSRIAPTNYKVQSKTISRQTHQVHFLLGNQAYDYYHPNRLTFYLLNNILGGSGMNSLLNLSLREKHGLVYQVDAIYQPFSDTGMWSIYFGCDANDVDKCERLVRKELKKLCEIPISDKMLKQAKLQLMGQLAISNEINESRALTLGKSLLRFGQVDDLSVICQKLENITSARLLDVANEIFAPNQLSVLKYV